MTLSQTNENVPQREWHSKPLDVTMEEEAEIVRATLHNQYSAKYEEFTQNDDVLVLIGTLLGDKNERKLFLTDPVKYGKMASGSFLSDRGISFACYYIECVMQNRIPNPIKYILDM